MCGVCVVYVQCMCGVCAVYVWRRGCAVYVWLMYGLCVAYVTCGVCAACDLPFALASVGMAAGVVETLYKDP